MASSLSGVMTGVNRLKSQKFFTCRSRSRGWQHRTYVAAQDSGLDQMIHRLLAIGHADPRVAFATE